MTEEELQAARAALEVYVPVGVKAPGTPRSERLGEPGAQKRRRTRKEVEPVIVNGEPMIEDPVEVVTPVVEAVEVAEAEVVLETPAPQVLEGAEAPALEDVTDVTDVAGITDLTIAPYTGEERGWQSLGETIRIETLTEVEQLEAHKSTIVKYLKYGDAIMFSIAEELDKIRQKELYKHDHNPNTGKAYRSMNEYMPFLLEELKTRAKLHKLSRRQVYEYLALKRVFVDQLGMSVSEIMEIGPSHFTEIREALDYDPRTGEITKEPRTGKIGAETALKLVSDLREAAEAGVEIRVQDTTKALDDQRGVQRRNVELQWVRNADGKTYYLSRVQLWWNEDEVFEPMYRVTEEQARWLTKKWGAQSNLPPEVF